MKRKSLLLCVMVMASPTVTTAQLAERPDTIETVLVHPFLDRPFACQEHWEGQLKYLYDALGADCFVLVRGREFRTDGSRNEDYYIWREEVLAPFDGVVAQVIRNPVVNEPGVLGKSPAGLIVFRRADGVHVSYAHIDSMRVAKGDSVRAGQVVARVSNNGMSRAPHVHIGARRGNHPLQIRWDLRAMGELFLRETEPGRAP
ncbi:MAG: M23 family metallopeptidase [Gemmatimonadaceae bacterium]